MSFAGHDSDMISRMRNNPEWHNLRKARQKKVLEAYQGHHAHPADAKGNQLTADTGESQEKE